MSSRRFAAFVTFGLFVMVLVLLGLSAGQPDSARAADLTVCPTGVSGCGYHSIQDAVDAAGNGDVIKVAAGIHGGVSVRPRVDVTTTGVVTQVVYLTKTLTIQGGYTTTNWTTPDPVANSTTLDAQGQGRVIYISGNISPTVEGLRITGGDAEGLGGSPAPGGDYDSGGGIYAITASVTLSNNWILSNTAADHWGGGFLLVNGANSALRGNTIANNSGHIGGGAVLYGSDGATLGNNTFYSNTASFYAGGLHLRYSDATLSDNLFESNTAEWVGSGLSLEECNGTLDGNLFIENSIEGDHDGGALDLYDSEATLRNNVLLNNVAGGKCSGLSIADSAPHIFYTTLVGDGSGGVAAIYVSDYEDSSNVELANTIVAGFDVGIKVDSVSTLAVDGILWHNTPTTIDQETGATVAVLNEHTGDPAFEADGYHLAITSAAIDRGTDVGVYVDIDGESRPQGGAFDLGADETGPVADLTLTKSDDPDPVVVDEPLVYTLVAANNGPASATAVVINDALPLDVPFVSASPGCSHVAGTVTCDLGGLAAGAVATTTITVRPVVTGSLDNQASVTGNEPDPAPANNLADDLTDVHSAPILDPSITGVTPAYGTNNRLTPITISGDRFQEGATALLDGTALGSVTFVSEHRLLAVVPSALAPGTYDLTVTNPDGSSGTLPGAFSVLTPGPPGVGDVVPAQGPNDTPVTIDIHGTNFAPSAEVSLSPDGAQFSLADLEFLDSTRLRAVVPVSTTPDLYDLTVANPDGQSDTVPDAYQALEPAANNDLYAGETDFWLEPHTVRELDTPRMGLTLRRQGGQADLHNVDVRFYVEGGTPTFNKTVALLPPRSEVTITVKWTPPPVQGDYALYAHIDPEDRIPENDENNNLISRTVTVLPPLPDSTPPTVTYFTVYPNRNRTSLRNVSLCPRASDNADGWGMAHLLFIEYVFVQSKGDWDPVGSSDWLPYDFVRCYPWQMSTQPGIHYFQAWAADRAGNISLAPGEDMINYWPEWASVQFRQHRVYRMPWDAGQTPWLHIQTGTDAQDAVSLRLYSPEGQELGSCKAEGTDGYCEFNRTLATGGVHQIEVVGLGELGNEYRLSHHIPKNTQLNEMGQRSLVEEEPTQPIIAPSSVPGHNVGLPSAPCVLPRVYLPSILKNSAP